MRVEGRHPENLRNNFQATVRIQQGYLHIRVDCIIHPDFWLEIEISPEELTYLNKGGDQVTTL